MTNISKKFLEMANRIEEEDIIIGEVTEFRRESVKGQHDHPYCEIAFTINDSNDTKFLRINNSFLLKASGVDHEYDCYDIRFFVKLPPDEIKKSKRSREKEIKNKIKKLEKELKTLKDKYGK